MTNSIDKDAIRTETLPLMTLVDAGNVAQRGLEKRLSSLKLSVAQQRILALVYFAKEALTPSMLAALLLQETHSVSGLLNRLEDRDLITRTRDRQDRRVVWVELTPEGRKVAEEAIDIVVNMSKELDPVLRPEGHRHGRSRAQGARSRIQDRGRARRRAQGSATARLGQLRLPQNRETETECESAPFFVSGYALIPMASA